MKNGKIPVLTESGFKNTIWCKEILEGIGKQNFFEIDESDLTGSENLPAVLIIGSSMYFINFGINECFKNNIKPIVVGTDYYDSAQNVSSVVIDRASATLEAIKYFCLLKKTPIALLGVSRYSVSDLNKKDAFLRASKSLSIDFSDDDVFYFDGGSVNCIEAFLEKARKYKAVICANDYFATLLIHYAAKKSVTVPDDLNIMGYGNSSIGKEVKPSISTIAPKYREMGIQASKMYAYLTANTTVNSVNVFVDYDIIIRESSGKIEKKQENLKGGTEIFPRYNSIFNDALIAKIKALDEVIYNADETTVKIMQGIVRDIPYLKLAETLYISDTAFRYRLNKIFKMTYCASRKELKELLQIVF